MRTKMELIQILIIEDEERHEHQGLTKGPFSFQFLESQQRPCCIDQSLFAYCETAFTEDRFMELVEANCFKVSSSLWVLLQILCQREGKQVLIQMVRVHAVPNPRKCARESKFVIRIFVVHTTFSLIHQVVNNACVVWKWVHVHLCMLQQCINEVDNIKLPRHMAHVYLYMYKLSFLCR